MSITAYTVEQARAAYVAVLELKLRLEQYTNGPAPALEQGRFTSAEVDAALDAAVTALAGAAGAVDIRLGAVDAGSGTVAAAATDQITATVTDSTGATENVTATATYESSDPAVATVSAAGLITGVAEGDCVITVRYGVLSDSIALTVTA